MRLLQFMQDGIPTLGIETETGIVKVAEAGKRLGIDVPKTMLEAIPGGETAKKALERLLTEKGTTEKLQYAPAVTGGEKILCVGLNYHAHIRESKENIPSYPLLFSKFANALSAHETCVRLSPEFTEYDYEAEMVIVIGKTAKDVPEERAGEYIFGYTCGNDLSNRETQLHRGGQWLIGKTMDGFAPLGPCVVTADSIDPSDLPIRSYVNGELRQNGRTSQMIFSCKKIVSYASHHMTLRAGDVIFTGTPAGVMLGYSESEKKWLCSGDLVEVEIGGIGVLRNRMI